MLLERAKFIVVLKKNSMHSRGEEAISFPFPNPQDLNHPEKEKNLQERERETETETANIKRRIHVGSMEASLNGVWIRL